MRGMDVLAMVWLSGFLSETLKILPPPPLLLQLTTTTMTRFVENDSLMDELDYGIIVVTIIIITTTRYCYYHYRQIC